MTFANKITLFRIISIPFFIAALSAYTPQKEYLKWIALGIFFLAIISDVIDGYIARTQKQRTKAGAILDPLADKALLVTAFIFVYRLSESYLVVKLPFWVLLIVLSRDTIILVGCLIILSQQHHIDSEPTWLGKMTTFFQMITISCVLLQFPFSWIVWSIAVAFTMISGYDYASKGIALLNKS